MNPTKQTPHSFLTYLLVCVWFASASAQPGDYRDSRAELASAYQQRDYEAMQVAARRALAARPEFPGGLFNLAFAQSLGGDPEASLRTLERLLQKGVDFDVANVDEFVAVRDLGSWDDYSDRVAALRTPYGDASIVATIDAPEFVPEGVAIDEAGDIYIGSIRTGALLRARNEAEIVSNGEGHWSVFGIRFHPDGSLWFASAAVPQLVGVGNDVGKTGLVRMDATSGEIMRSAILPQRGDDAQVLGDLIIADDDTIYTTDSLSGAVYRYRIGANEFEVLVERGTLASPQGLVLDESGENLYVADYVGGLYCVSLKDGALVKLNVDASVTDYGIDGLYRFRNNLIAIQNGVRPHRVAAFELSSDGLAIADVTLLAANLDEFDEPTLGVVNGDDFYFVANSHWNRFDAENQLPDGLAGPIILRLSLQL